MKSNLSVWASARRLALYASLALGVVAAPSTAAEASAKVTVSMTILKHAKLTVMAEPSVVVVTARDILRGFVDVPAAAQVAVHTNSPRYMLEIGSHGDFMRQIVVRGLGADIQLSPAGGNVTQEASSTSVTKATLALGFRFLLSEAAREGTYAWPVRLAVTPL